jgi:hypothetical protein
MALEILDFQGIKSLGITRDAMEDFGVPMVRSRSAVKYGAIFGEGCIKVLGLDGSYSWDGEYNPSMGLFGQKAAIPGEPLVIVPSELEALKLASAGVHNTVCLAQPDKNDAVTFDILIDGLKTVSDTILVWQGTSFENSF